MRLAAQVLVFKGKGEVRKGCVSLHLIRNIANQDTLIDTTTPPTCPPFSLWRKDVRGEYINGTRVIASGFFSNHWYGKKRIAGIGKFSKNRRFYIKLFSIMNNLYLILFLMSGNQFIVIHLWLLKQKMCPSEEKEIIYTEVHFFFFLISKVSVIIITHGKYKDRRRCYEKLHHVKEKKSRRHKKSYK